MTSSFKKFFNFVGIISVASLVSCATARMVNVEVGEGGEIAVSPRDNQEARDKATLIMQQNCGAKKFKIVKEGEVVVGQSTSASTHIDDGRPSYYGTRSATVNTTQHSQDVKEWHIYYKCVSANAKH